MVSLGVITVEDEAAADALPDNVPQNPCTPLVALPGDDAVSDADGAALVDAIALEEVDADRAALLDEVRDATVEPVAAALPLGAADTELLAVE